MGLGGLLAMLATTRAQADWLEGPALPAPPSKILDVWGVGTYSVGYERDQQNTPPQGACLIKNRVIVRDIANHKSMGTFYKSVEDCFVSLKSDAYRLTKGANGLVCGGINSNLTVIGDPVTVTRVKHTPQGSSAVLAELQSDWAVYVSNQGIGDPNVSYGATPVWRDNVGVRPLEPYAVVQLSGEVQFMLGIQNSATDVPFGWWIHNQIPKNWPERYAAGNPKVGDILAVALFDAGDAAVPRMVVATRDALFQDAPDQPGERFSTKIVDAPLGGQFLDVSMNVGAGSLLGEGFGMALVRLSDGRVRVLSPVPMETRASAGTAWLERTLPSPIAAKMMGVNRVACHGADFCAFSAQGKSTDSLFTYTNEYGPELALDGGTGVSVEAGGSRASMTLAEESTATLSLGANDPDGDPLRITAPLSNLAPSLWDAGLQPQAAGEPVRMLVSTGRVCETTRLGSFNVRASDGWQTHDLQKDVDVNVKHTRPPQPPRVTLAGGLQAPLTGTLEAGGAALELTPLLNEPTSNLCGWAPSAVWTKDSPNGPTLDRQGNTARISPPATFCEAGGRDFPFTLQSTDTGGLTVSQTFTFRLLPWGKPERVFNPATSGEAVMVAAKGSATLKPLTPQHACQTVSGFPGVVTSWTVKGPGGGVAGDDYVIQSTAGGPELQNLPTVEAQGLVLSARECRPESTLTVQAEQRVSGGNGPVSASSERQIRFLSGRPALSQGTLTAADGPEQGALSLTSNLDCASERHLRAELQLLPEGAEEPLSVAPVNLPGVWTPARDIACGRYTLRAALKDDTGQGGFNDLRSLELAGPGVRLEAVPETRLKAVCGQGASIALSDLARPTADTCQTPRYTWKQGSGTPLEPTTAADGMVTLRTKSQDLNALLGQEVTGEVVASKGDASASLPITTRITTEPFIQVERTTELPAASETGLVGVLVRLTNTTACDVSEVDYLERLEGLSFVAGSARLDGMALEANAREDGAEGLAVKLPLLEAGSTRTLSYVARPHLLGERRMEGEALKNDVLLSRSDTAGPPRESCGCTSAGAAPMLLVLSGLGVLGGVPRRRRARHGDGAPTARS